MPGPRTPPPIDAVVGTDDEIAPTLLQPMPSELELRLLQEALLRPPPLRKPF